MNLLSSIVALWAGSTTIDAFTIAASASKTNRLPSTTRLRAAAAGGGAPQYDKFDATLRRAERVGDGSYMLRIDASSPDGEDLDYEPGHVLALEIELDDGIDDGDEGDAESKTRKDAAENGGWMRGPYTVSRSTPDTLDVLIKAVGEKSRRLASAAPGTPVRFGGKFKVPILEGVDATSTDLVVMVSTGVGVGPCVGAIEEALLGRRRRDGGSGSNRADFPPIHLVASYRTRGEVLYREHLDELQRDNPDRFSWREVITSERGRLSSSVDNMKELTNTSLFHDNAGMGTTHYHLIGNGQMVSEFQRGLERAGVPEGKITLEMYFNHRADVSDDAVDRIAHAMVETTRAVVNEEPSSKEITSKV